MCVVYIHIRHVCTCTLLECYMYLHRRVTNSSWQAGLHQVMIPADVIHTDNPLTMISVPFEYKFKCLHSLPQISNCGTFCQPTCVFQLFLALNLFSMARATQQPMWLHWSVWLQLLSCSYIRFQAAVMVGRMIKYQEIIHVVKLNRRNSSKHAINRVDHAVYLATLFPSLILGLH